MARKAILLSLLVILVVAVTCSKTESIQKQSEPAPANSKPVETPQSSPTVPPEIKDTSALDSSLQDLDDVE